MATLPRAGVSSSGPACGKLRTRERLLIAGCGDVGLRLLAHLASRIAAGRLEVIAITRDPAKRTAARTLGARSPVIDLDDGRALRRLAGFAGKVVYLAPPPPTGIDDPRLRRLIAACSRSLHADFRVPSPRPTTRPRSAAKWTVLSTTGVYGNCGGAQIDETRPVAPGTARARRRLAAEAHVRRAVRAGLLSAAILRVPGIYAHDRLPLARLRRGDPVLHADDDVYTNHIHADDLAVIAWVALYRGRPGRIVNAVDDSRLPMGEWFDRVADACGLPHPPRATRDALAARVSPAMLSFLDESRRVSNRRLAGELRVRLRWPTVDSALREVAEERRQSADPALL